MHTPVRARHALRRWRHPLLLLYLPWLRKMGRGGSGGGTGAAMKQQHSKQHSDTKQLGRTRGLRPAEGTAQQEPRRTGASILECEHLRIRQEQSGREFVST